MLLCPADPSVFTRGPCTDDSDFRARSVVPLIQEVSVVKVEVDGRVVELAPWNLPCMEDCDRLRSISYPNTHVIVICFAIDSLESLESVQTLVTDVTSGVLMM